VHACVSVRDVLDIRFRDMLLTQKLLWVRSVPYSLPSNTAMLLLLLTERERQSTSGNDRYQSCFHFTTPLTLRSTDLNPLDYKLDGEKCNSRSTKFMTLMNWSRAWSLSGMVLSSVINDAGGKWCKRLCVGIRAKEEILNISFNSI